VLPAMFSKAELCTAMPRAGGTYYFLDRSLGPMVGTVGGLGTWLALVLKSGFALVGMGAYLTLFLDWPVRPVALGLIGVFTVLNVVGAKETTGFQKILVVTLLAILGFFVVQGLWEVWALGPNEVHRTQFTPFFAFGLEGLVATVGLVFVSYAGLTKVASVAEEVRNPDRDIPLGMFLSLATATALYVVGVYVMVAVLEPGELRQDLTPVATAGEAFLDWLPAPAGLILMVIAAVAAFASTGNAGILSASRYPLAMARDRLVPGGLGKVGKLGTPVPAILITSSVMAACILLLDVEAIAKLASAFQLVVFQLLCLAVVVMRESGIRGYHPGYRSPLYPWMQIAGIVVPVWLIIEMGWMAVAFTTGVAIVGVVWYWLYARGRTARDGAIYHVFERLGRRRYEGLDREMLHVFQEKGLRTGGVYEEMVARSMVLDLQEKRGFGEVVDVVSGILARRTGADDGMLNRGFLEVTRRGGAAFFRGAGVPHVTVEGVESPELVLVRSRTGIDVTEWVDPGYVSTRDQTEVRALCFLISTTEDPGLHVRILAELVTRLGEEGFMKKWLEARDATELRELLIRDDSYLVVTLDSQGRGRDLVGRTLRSLELPGGSLVGAVRRGHRIMVPTGETVLQDGDRITVIGEPAVIQEVRSRLDGVAATVHGDGSGAD
ncbi:MAG: amino acid permease, partial [Longimicrobiales bacterium]|nr:amino acid permease [Longimicrobiales bacterium]